MLAAGCLLIWARSELVGTVPIREPVYSRFTGKVLAVERQAALSRQRLLVATREPGSGRAIRIRLNLPDTEIQTRDGRLPSVRPAVIPQGSVIRFSARLMPPAPPMLPGGYNFARTAWFSGLAASGTVTSQIVILESGKEGAGLAVWRKALADHVQRQVRGPGAGIAAALVSGDRGGISQSDEQAMRDSGLAHLLAISGLHVSAVIGLVYFLSLRVLALVPSLALRLRLPVVAAAFGAMAGLGYTLMTGAQVPTVRSCLAGLLVLCALALGREALSLRMLAVAAFAVMCLWPEAVVGPSFQMSFAAVLAIGALSSSEPVRRFLGPREEGILMRILRWFAMLLVSGIAIELALMPIALFHFHRSGLFGSGANLIAIPLTTFVIMPGILMALFADLVGLGAPCWWLVERAIALVLAVAHWVARQPGAVTVLPAMGGGAYGLFLFGGLWLGLQKGRARLLGLVPALLGSYFLARLEPPDLLIAGDGHNVGVVDKQGGVAPRLLLLRDSRSQYVRDNFLELAGISGEIAYLPDWPDASCNPDFCSLHIVREGRIWVVLISRSRDVVPERSLAAACDTSDIVISERWLPHSCQPRWIKVDRALLSRTGGLSLDLKEGRVTTVSERQGAHGWWRASIGR